MTLSGAHAAPARAPRVCIVGSGVSGLGAADVLRDAGVDFVVYEAGDHVGGHAHTVRFTASAAPVDVDIGFMVCNEVTYPNMLAWFRRHGVQLEHTTMTMAMSVGGTEWSSDAPFAQKRNALRPAFLGMLAQIRSFNASAQRWAESAEAEARPNLTLGEFVRERRFSQAFLELYLLPMICAIWSTEPRRALDFPCRSLFAFMRNHLLLHMFKHPTWMTVRERTARGYVDKVTAAYRDRIVTRAGVTRLQRDGDAWLVHDARGGAPERFDHVLFACHPPQARAILDASLAALGDDAVRAALGDTLRMLSRFSYTRNDVYVHSDAAHMPRTRAAWSAWNIVDAGEERTDGAPLEVTYWLNKLQHLRTDANVFVTLNPRRAPTGPAQHYVLEHPLFDPSALIGQTELPHVQGTAGIWHASAAYGWGFHECGFRSGVVAAKGLLLATGVRSAAQLGLALPAAVPRDDALAMARAITLDPNGTNATLAPHEIGESRPLARALAPAARWAVHRALREHLRVGRLTLRDLQLAKDEVFGSVAQSADGKRALDVLVELRDPASFYTAIAASADMGLARAYIAGAFECSDLATLFEVFVANRAPDTAGTEDGFALALASYAGRKVDAVRHWLRRNTLEQSVRNIRAHYDLGNDLFESFLDSSMMYSSGIYNGPSCTLEQAQANKVDALLRKLRPRAGQRVLDLGCGWGTVSIELARRHGCRVTGLTLSREQKAFAERRVREAGLEHLVSVELCDYRTHAPGHAYDRIVSCEMLEAVGFDFLGDYFAALERLAPGRDAIAVLQVITMPEQRFADYVRTNDFIREYIFPGGCCPSMQAMQDAIARRSTFVVDNVENIGLHYARTLRDWRERFVASKHAIRAHGYDSDEFWRTWLYYFDYCEAGFRTRSIGNLQLVLGRPGCADLMA